MMARPDWDQTFFDICDVLSRRSPDPRTRLGSVIVRPDKTVCSVGYNSLPKGVSHRPELLERPLKSTHVCHAEENALLFAREPVDGYIVYVPILPCMRCARMLVQKGIGEVVVDARRVAEYTSPEYTQEFSYVRAMFGEIGVAIREWRTP